MKKYLVILAVGLILVFIYFVNFSASSHNYLTINTDQSNASSLVSDNAEQTNKQNQSLVPKLSNKTHEHNDENEQQGCNDDPYSETCTQTPESTIIDQLIDKDTGFVKTNEVIIALQTANFKMLQEQLSAKKNDSDSYVMEEELNTKLRNQISSYSDLNGSDVSCSDSICAFNVLYTNEQIWNKFSEQFFSTDQPLLGNVFIYPMTDKSGTYEQRIMLAPGSGNSVIQ